VDVIFHFSPTFNPDSINLELTSGKDAISMTIPDAPPLVHGMLAAPLQRLSGRSVSGTSLTFTFKKARPADWPFLITGPHPQTGRLDPQSGFVMFQSSMQQDGWNEASQHWLEMSGSAGYCPALLAGWDLFQRSQETAPKAIEWLRIAATAYDNPEACFLLGMVLMSNQNCVAVAFDFLQRAANAGIVHAWARLAQLLSPLSDYEFEAKDAEQAVALLENVRRRTPNDPVMCYELSKLYFNGVGVEKNEALARELDQIARKELQDLPELKVMEITPKEEPPKKDEGSTLGTAAVVAIAVGAVVAAGFLGWLAYRRRNR
jgi:hypothetical protein